MGTGKEEFVFLQSKILEKILQSILIVKNDRIYSTRYSYTLRSAEH